MTSILTILFKDNERFLRFDMLPKDIQNKLLLWIEWKYRNALDEAIDNFWLENPRIPITASFYNENIFNLYTRYYNIQQWIDEDTILDDEFLSDKDKQVLQTKFNATLKLLWKRVEDGDIDTSYLRKQEGRDWRIREENQKRLEEWKRRNREMNNKKNKIRKWKIPSPEKAEDLGKTIDMQSASGVDIAKQVWLWKQLNEKYGNKNSQEDLQPDDQLYLSNRAFSIARSRFIQSHSGLKSVVTDEIVLSLYNQDKNSIKTLDDKARDPLKKIFQDSPEELTKLYNQLLNFPNEVNSVKEKLQRGSRFVKIIKDENKNNYAAGVIIDNIRGIFSENQENKWEKINSRLRLNSVKIEWDDLVMLWKYDEVNMMVQYNLKTGEIFMNSFFQYSNDQSKITLWDNLSIRQSVWYLAPFDNILTDNNLLISQVNLLSNIVVDKSKKQSATNSIIVKFMKTFNIVPTQWEFENLEFNSGSNLFDVIQIIEKTGDPKTGNIQSLEYFNNTFMPTIMKYSCLKRWENNLLGPQKNEVDGDVYDITFNESNKSQYISSIRDSANNFSQNLQKFKHGKIKNYDSDYQLWFADFIKNNFVEWNKPDWKLNFSKMSDFIGHLEADGKES